MKKFKGTLGPWVRAKSCPKIIMSGSVFDDSEGYIIGSVTGNDNSGFYADEAEACANANLIAAAPDLLEALQDVLYEISTTREVHDGTIRQADAAITKALGEK